MSALGEPVTIRVATGSLPFCSAAGDSRGLWKLLQPSFHQCQDQACTGATGATVGLPDHTATPAPGERVTLRENQNPEESTGVHSPENVLRGNTNDANGRIKHHLLHRVFAQDQPCGDFSVQ